MHLNGYFGVRSLEAIIDGLKNMDPRAEMALFLALGIGAYGYFKYCKGGTKDGKQNEA